MPARQGLCWCLGGSPRPPEIKHGLAIAAPVQSITLDIPMPTDEHELNTKFEELVAELGLDKAHRDALYSLPAEKKWQIYCSKKMDVGTSKQNGVDYYIEKMFNINSNHGELPEDGINSSMNIVENLKTALRTQTLSFVVSFIEKGGLQCLLDFLSKMEYETSEGPLHTSVIGCIKALMNNSQGRAHVLAHPDCMNIIAQSLAVENVKTKIAALEILGAICLVPGGHRKVLNAMLHFQKYAGERTRFQLLIYDLDRSTGKYKEEVALKTAVMSFINAALKYGAGQDHLEFRLHLRYEFLMLGIVPIIKKMRAHGNTTLDRHLDFFEMVRNEDEKEFAKRFDGVHIDSKSATAMFDVLRKKLHLSTAYPNLLSILHHMLLIPYGKNDVLHVWPLVDKIVQQIVLQLKKGEDPDGAPLEEINIKQLIRQLASETDIKSFQTKLREAEKASDELAAKLAKKERECEVRLEEKDELMSTMNMMKAKLEKEVAAHAETRQQLQDLLSRVEEIRSQLDTERGEKQKLQHLVQTGSLPDDAKMGLTTAASSIISSLESKKRDIPLYPPPPPPPNMPAPPPPPPAPGAPMPSTFGMNGCVSSSLAAKFKGNPKPSVPMKSFNWTKIAENQVSGTIWNDLNHSKVYSILDLEDFQRTFSAYQKPVTEDGEDDYKNTKSKTQVLTVIDGRRSQNCTILLSKLKLTNEELAKAIMNVDEGEDLPKDMVEQLLKFVPTAEEIQLLSEYAHEIENMARADRFLFEMSKILHYEERLKALYFKKKFQERKVDCKQKIDAVFEASKEVFRSRKLKKVLELVLAMGNFMNKGQRGSALGFKVSSLSKMIDTKASTNKNMTLLHYLVELADKKFPDLMKLDEELPHVHDAAKVNFTDLEKEITNLRKGLQSIEKEVEFFEKKLNITSQDKFVSVMKDFCTVAAYNFTSVEDSYNEMKQKYETILKAFCEDPKQVQPEDFFGTIDSFVTGMIDTRHENEKFKKQKDEEDKRKQLEEQLKKEREKRIMLRRGSNLTDKKGSANTATENGDKGEFDDLISALRTGDVFGEDMAKLAKRNRKRVTNASDFSRERQGSVTTS
ncbi:disheveled-associated activator of morphogenesis 2-like [Physella acuta]|uniref:disheveled-associated activator of morphogenesis 2-like n=1 Tax=Physella acuta TaxID=109671 RepID=UPI0027DC3A85|nr:disheveled-associated activator of morphogenesis 2-like [Physella acuta]